MSKASSLAPALVGSLLLISQAPAQDTIRVGWTIPAEEAKYWMMRRPQEFPDLGKAYKVEWTQFQGTAPMVQAMVAGALDCSTQGVSRSRKARRRPTCKPTSSRSMSASAPEVSPSIGR
jgi:ABC-type nitrate/sulfonate/bicarbonate transport system substrate-binding protein